LSQYNLECRIFRVNTVHFIKTLSSLPQGQGWLFSTRTRHGCPRKTTHPCRRSQWKEDSTCSSRGPTLSRCHRIWTGRLSICRVFRAYAISWTVCGKKL